MGNSTTFFNLHILHYLLLKVGLKAIGNKLVKERNTSFFYKIESKK